MAKGRPPKYHDKVPEQALKLCRLGATDKELADFFGVKEATINQWKLDHPAFSDSLKEGKYLADAEVASKLFKRATGYSHPEDKIFNDNGSAMVVPTMKHYPPDTTACIFWLKNRQPAKWRDKVEGNDGERGNIEEAARIFAQAMASTQAPADNK